MAIFDADELSAMRAAVEETFADSCTLNEPDGESVFDPNTGTYTETPGAEVYAGACAVAPTGGERVVLVAGDPVTLRTYTVRLPWDVDGAAVDQLVTVTTVDGHLNGRTLRVLDVQGRTTPIERVLIAEDNLG